MEFLRDVWVSLFLAGSLSMMIQQAEAANYIVCKSDADFNISAGGKSLQDNDMYFVGTIFDNNFGVTIIHDVEFGLVEVETDCFYNRETYFIETDHEAFYAFVLQSSQLIF